MSKASTSLPETGFLRLAQIIGNKKTGTPPLIPISRTSFLNGVSDGRFPKPVSLGKRTVAWKIEDIRELIKSLGQ
jgi:prophage regulatory protein